MIKLLFSFHNQSRLIATKVNAPEVLNSWRGNAKISMISCIISKTKWFAGSVVVMVDEEFGI